MRKRHAAVLPIAAALALGPLAGAPASASVDAASALSAARQSTTVKAVAGPVTKPTVTPQPAKPQPAKPQPAKPQPARPVGKPVVRPSTVVGSFTAAGTLTAVDPATSTVTVLLSGGSGGKDARGTSDTFTVAATARISLDSVAAGLATLPVGGLVSVQGLSAAGVRAATKVAVVTAPAPSANTPAA